MPEIHSLMATYLRSLLFVPLFFGPFFASAQNTITTDSVIQLSTCPGQTVIVTFSTTGTFDLFNNTFYAELSDGWGNFSNPDTIGTTIISFLHIIFATLPQDMGFGINYRVRVVSDNPPVIGSESPNGIFITVIPGLDVISADPDQPVCEPGTVTLSAGFGGSTYEWSSGDTTQSITVGQTGEYTVTVTDFVGCVYNPEPAQVTILTPVSGLDTMTASPDYPVCEPLTITLTAPAGGNTYEWSNGESTEEITVATSGLYTLTITDSVGCPHEPPPLQVTIYDGGEVPVISVVDNQLSSTPAFHYQWYHDSVLMYGDTLQNFNATDEGEYYLVTTTEHGCQQISAPVTITLGDEILVFPNPFEDIISMEGGLIIDEFFGYRMVDVFGRIVRSLDPRKFTGTLSHEIETATLANGFYILEVDYKGRIYFFNVVKQ